MTDFPPMPERIRAIIDRVATEHRVQPVDLVGPSATRKTSRARWAAYACIVDTVTIAGSPPSLPQIGRWFNRDHTTVLYGLRRHCSDLAWTKVRRPDSYKLGRQHMVAPIRLQLAADMRERHG